MNYWNSKLNVCVPAFRVLLLIYGKVFNHRLAINLFHFIFINVYYFDLKYKKNNEICQPTANKTTKRRNETLQIWKHKNNRINRNKLWLYSIFAMVMMIAAFSNSFVFVVILNEFVSMVEIRTSFI